MKNWNTISYDLSKNILTRQSLSFYIGTFWNDLFDNLNDSQFVALFIVVEYSDQMKSLAKASKVNKNDLDKFTKIMIDHLNFKDSQYLSTEVVNLHFKYKFITKEI